MTERNHKAKLLYWQSLTPDQKSFEMSNRRKKGWRKVSKADRLLQGRRLTDIRLAKQKLSTP